LGRIGPARWNIRPVCCSAHAPLRPQGPLIPKTRTLTSACRAPPDVAFVHELDLPVDDLAAVLGVGVRGTLEVEVLRVHGLFVDDLVLLGGEILDPVVPLRAGPELPQIQAGQPRGGLDQVREVLDVPADLVAMPDARIVGTRPRA
jgi:hypothetical protein